jgi:hypothetical protein
MAPQFIMVADPDKKPTFKAHFNIYISFYSVQGINIEASAKFIDVNEFRKRNMDKRLDSL